MALPCPSRQQVTHTVSLFFEEYQELMTENQSPIENDHAELMHSLYFWREESLSHITKVRGYLELLLLGEKQKLLSLEQRNFLEAALSSTDKSVEWWNIAVDSIKYRYKIHLPEPQSISLHHILDMVKSTLGHNPYVAELTIMVPEKLPEIKATFPLATAIEYLVLPKPEFAYLSSPYYRLEKPFLPRIIVSENADRTLTINIQSDLQIRLDENTVTNEYFYPGSCLSLAKSIIEELGNFQMRQLDTGVEFRLNIPLWEDLK